MSEERINIIQQSTVRSYNIAAKYQNDEAKSYLRLFNEIEDKHEAMAAYLIALGLRLRRKYA